MENKEIMVQGIANERAIFKRLKERGGCDNVLSSRFFLKDVGSTTGTFIKIEDHRPIYHVNRT